MRKRKLMIGAASALALSVAVAGIAQGAGTLTGQTITETVSSPAQDKKAPGAITTFKTAVDTQYTGTTPPFTGKVSNTKVDFPKDFVFTPGTLPQCNPATIASADTAGAIATCGASQVGSGDATLNGAVQNVPAKVTAFNGTTPEGLPTVLLHSRTGAPLNTTAVLIGTLRPGPGGVYGKTLDVVVPLLAGGAFVITAFRHRDPEEADGQEEQEEEASRPSSTSARSAARRPGTSRSARPLMPATRPRRELRPCRASRRRRRRRRSRASSSLTDRGRPAGRPLSFPCR